MRCEYYEVPTAVDHARAGDGPATDATSRSGCRTRVSSYDYTIQRTVATLSTQRASNPRHFRAGRQVSQV